MNKKFFKISNPKIYTEDYVNVNGLKHEAKTINKKIKRSDINWTQHAWNPWMGCRKVSAACLNCYIIRFLRDPYKEVLKAKMKTWMKPYLLKEPSLIFVGNLSDFFIEDADEWREYAWKIIRDNPQHTFQILTKRPERIKKCLPDDWGNNGYNNVWLGVTVENDKPVVKNRLRLLREIPAKIRFVSVEPIYKEFNFTRQEVEGFDWFILGGESGKDNRPTGIREYRPCNPKWIYKLLKQLKSFGKYVFVKQLGTYVAKKVGLNSKHGEDIYEFPKELRMREMPTEQFKPRNNRY